MARNTLLLSFYGDDFTGSTDVMETLSVNGIATILFLQTPSIAEVENIQLKTELAGRKLRAFGVAGIARSLDPLAMEEELDPIFAKLAHFSTDYFLYKICSTLDSSPSVGNIGTAINVALKYFPAQQIPFIVGAPFLNRFVIFGNLFARLDNVTYRLDRHPVMSVHPVTPMQESDVSRHLAKLTALPVRSIDRFQLEAGLENIQVDDQGESSAASLIVFDTLTNEDLEVLGEYLYLHWKGSTQLLVGSSGITYGLAKYLATQVSTSTSEHRPAVPVNQILVVAGSCSPVTARQIQHSLDLGFTGVRLDVIKLLAGARAHLTEVCKEVSLALEDGRSVIVYTALGPTDPSIERVQKRQIGNLNSQLGEGIGEIVSSIVRGNSSLRCVVVGGDTSGYVARHLGIYALEMLAPIAPGAPLCVAHARDPMFDGLEIALKGGQNGKDDYFQRILNGK